MSFSIGCGTRFIKEGSVAQEYCFQGAVVMIEVVERIALWRLEERALVRVKA